MSEDVKANSAPMLCSPSCFSCGETDAGAGDDYWIHTCNSCGKMFCEDCCDWCAPDYDDCGGDYFCRGCQAPEVQP